MHGNHQVGQNELPGTGDDELKIMSVEEVEKARAFRRVFLNMTGRRCRSWIIWRNISD